MRTPRGPPLGGHRSGAAQPLGGLPPVQARGLAVPPDTSVPSEVGLNSLSLSNQDGADPALFPPAALPRRLLHPLPLIWTGATARSGAPCLSSKLRLPEAPRIRAGKHIDHRSFLLENPAGLSRGSGAGVLGAVRHRSVTCARGGGPSLRNVCRTPLSCVVPTGSGLSLKACSAVFPRLLLPRNAPRPHPSPVTPCSLRVPAVGSHNEPPGRGLGGDGIDLGPADV